ncbi:hypothetical protein [Actinoplanes derwentensis]|uniref:Uncharacterized protein n=1 Tax=Actinoplanes derwentensis TaxID=113562 RepID=A0A1H2DEH2_9ACTN|nr:hypothetical protein [Actinoplanes derwentensis]GID84780.1 hypothetical protein Ade03nite_37040 [Actinoplanes derwentensis]SDT81111.1 hypothetical protein SAMN04489716_9499 [Actinoplanes derwentensis]
MTAFAGLDRTVVGGWVRRLAGNTSPRRNHWNTKTTYYRAAATVLNSGPRSDMTWKTIVAAAEPRGCRSTFYEVAGAHARHRMIDALIGDGRSESLQIALRYLRTDPVEQLIDEAKVWSFWAFRQRFTQRLTTAMSPGEMEDELFAEMAEWARWTPALAQAVGQTPPACAVEDLTVIHGLRVSGIQAAERLTEVVRRITL